MNDIHKQLSTILAEKAKIVGKVDLGDRRSVTTFAKRDSKLKLPSGMGKAKQNPDFITKADLKSLEGVLDRLFAHYNIDIEFTKHFQDQVNLARNQKQITIEELSKMFRKVYTKFGSKLATMKDREAVLVDLQSKINVPFVLKHDKKGDIDLVSKTVMRKDNFKTSNQKLKVEMKTFKQIINETTVVQPSEFEGLAGIAVKYLQKELKSIFSGQETIAYYDDGFGQSIVVGVYSIKSGASQIDRMNSNSNAQFMMHFEDNFGNKRPLSKFTFEKNSIRGPELPLEDPNKAYMVKRKKIAYRKITGKTPLEASKKLVAWFKKNKADFTV